uniref:Protein SYS1 homolog n=2 Tax=Triatominae TaxID=70999 RepID=A0A0V0GAI9_TRIDM
MTKLTGQFRNTVWDPILIISQIIAVQSIFYLTLGVWLITLDFIVGASRSLDHIFKYQEIHGRDGIGKLIIISYLLNSLTGAVSLWCLVQRTKLCLDFSATAHFFHLVLCWIYNGYFPTTISWWLLNIISAGIMCICGELLCMRTELKAIPLTSTPKVGL